MSTQPSTGETKYARQARWREKNPVARWAHIATASAIRRGIIVPPDVCEDCGEARQLDAHHPDHRNPLLVRFLCRSCHQAEHRRAKAEGGG